VRRVGDLARTEQVTVREDLPLSGLLDTFVASRRNHVYVVDSTGTFIAR